MGTIIPMDLDRFDRDRLARKCKRDNRRRAEKKYRDKSNRFSNDGLFYKDFGGGVLA